VEGQAGGVVEGVGGEVRIACAILACLALGAVISCTHRDGSSEPKDQELLTIFNAHREAFEKLQQMATEDAKNGRYFCEPYLEQAAFEGIKIDEARLHEYKTLIAEIHPGLDWSIDGHDNTVRFMFAGEGSAIGPSWVKGIEFVAGNYERHGLIQTNLDQASRLPANAYINPIETNWFLFYQRDE
jgi:hypothetical protein